MLADVEMEYMDTSETPWCWYYLADCGGWHKFEDDPYYPLKSEDFESYYQRNTKQVQLQLSSCHILINFSEMLHIDLNTKQQRRIHRNSNIGRSCLCSSAPPVLFGKVDPTSSYQDSVGRWCWYYLADCGRWHRFEDNPCYPLSSEDIEICYKKNPKGVLNRTFFSYHIMIDFSAMLQTNLNTRQQRRICRNGDIGRSCSCFSAPPDLWEKFDPTCPYQLIPLSEPSPEYQHVADYVKKDGLLDKTIVSINRIQNLDLWELFCRKKKQLMRIQGVKEIEEKILFHGTENRNVDLICKYNFDLRLSGQHAHVYGKGIYFAKHASYADKYSRSSRDPLPLYGGETRGTRGERTNIIFLARVMVGKSTEGQRHFQKPDHGSSENTHYSCVNDISNPTIFVIFDPNQIYPEYVIQYK